MKGAFNFVRKYWIVIGVLGGTITTVAGGVVHVWYTVNVEPKVTSFVHRVTDEYMNDSLGIQVDRHMRTKGGGFRGGLANFVNEEKVNIIPLVGDMLLNQDSIKAAIGEAREQADYAREIANLLIGETFKDTVNEGVKLKIAPSGDMYYIDSLKIPWAAVWKNRIGKWVIFPTYHDNKQTLCK